MPDHAHTPRRLWLVVFVGGTATMALQMAAVRLLAPAVGASSIVWATVIGLSLLAMSLGYVLGGRLGDRRSDGATLARTLGAAALLVAMIPLVAPLLLERLPTGFDNPAVADLVGAGIGYVVLVLAPALLMGVTPPYAIRLAIPRVEDAGRTAGGLYALSTLGSIAGTLLAALVLVQWIGTRWTLWGIAASLVVAALVARTVRPVHAGANGPTHAPASIHAVSADTPVRAGAGVIPVTLAGTIVLVEGMAMMATEMSIVRLVAPFFGASHAVWAVVIATVMGSIALGSRLGGRAADRWPSLGALVVLLAASAVAVAVLPFLTSPVMRMSTGGIDDVAVGMVVGTFLATMALLVVPVTLLGMVPPWAMRLAVPDVARAGRTAGRMYALSTAGALVGTFASVLWLIPAIGTRRTMLLFAGALALLATVVLARRVSRLNRGRAVLLAPASLVLVVALAFAPTGLVKPLDDATVIDERESRYQFIQVVQASDGRRLLQLNEGWAVHSIWNRDTVLTGGIWDHFLVVPALHDPVAPRLGSGSPWSAGSTLGIDVTDAGAPHRMLVIGSAAGTSKRAFAQLRPSIEMTSVELDTEVTAVGREHFELEGEVAAADGRPFLARTDDEWDVIHVDAYRQPYIPFYLTTREFFELAKARLARGGVVSINVGSAPADPRINEAVAATMREVFPIVVRYRAERYNEVIVGVDEPGVTLDQLRERIRSSDLGDGTAPVFKDLSATDLPSAERPLRGDLLDERRAMQRLFNDFAIGMFEVQPDPGKVLTDDRAPVEWMTDRMIFGEAG
jgi:predicted membrane-bound spermidine synthase